MKKVVVITSDIIGKDQEIGQTLMRLFLNNLAMAVEVPDEIILMNAGVKLACAGSEVLEPLQALAAREVTISACGTCLDFYDIREQLLIGEGGTMAGTVAALMSAQDAVVVS